MTSRTFRLSALLLITAALGAGCDVHVGETGVSVDVASGKATDDWTRTYELTKGGAVEIVNVNGPIGDADILLPAAGCGPADLRHASPEQLECPPIVEGSSSAP